MEELYKKKLEDTMDCLRRLMEVKDKILTKGDFNCKEMSRVTWSTDASRGNKVLELVIDI